MSVFIQAALPEPSAALRFLLRPDPSIIVPCADRKRNKRHRPPVLRLVGHLATTAFVFVSLITLVWVVSCMFSFMHSVHAFPEEIFRLFVRLEIALVYLDAIVSGVALLAGISRYILNVLRGDS
jgi:hypothetical protein